LIWAQIRLGTIHQWFAITSLDDISTMNSIEAKFKRQALDYKVTKSITNASAIDLY